MCECNSSETPASLHEKFCRITRGIPCKAVHAVMGLILGKTPASGCGCGGHEAGAEACGCSGPAASDAPAKSKKSGCGCGGHA